MVLIGSCVRKGYHVLATCLFIMSKTTKSNATSIILACSYFVLKFCSHYTTPHCCKRGPLSDYHYFFTFSSKIIRYIQLTSNLLTINQWGSKINSRIWTMMLRILKKPRNQMFLLIIGNVILLFAMYSYVSRLQETLRGTQWSGERCMSELKSLNYQLNVVTEYKNRIDQLLSESQKAHQFEKEIVKDIMESCDAMKQQTLLCQSQFEDLQSECRKVREDYDRLTKNSEKFKTST